MTWECFSWGISRAKLASRAHRLNKLFVPPAMSAAAAFVLVTVSYLSISLSPCRVNTDLRRVLCFFTSTSPHKCRPDTAAAPEVLHLDCCLSLSVSVSHSQRHTKKTGEISAAGHEPLSELHCHSIISLHFYISAYWTHRCTRGQKREMEEKRAHADTLISALASKCVQWGKGREREREMGVIILWEMDYFQIRLLCCGMVHLVSPPPTSYMSKHPLTHTHRHLY